MNAQGTQDDVMKDFVRSYTIQIAYGLHARPCSRIAKIAKDYGVQGFVKMGEASANIRSILHLMLLAATVDSELTIEAKLPGDKFDRFHSEISELFSNKEA